MRPWQLLLLQAPHAEVNVPGKCGWVALIAHRRQAL
jgi:hypothetical protein